MKSDTSGFFLNYFLKHTTDYGIFRLPEQYDLSVQSKIPVAMLHFMKTFMLIVLVSSLATQNLRAETWELTNIKGYSARGNNIPKYKYENDELPETITLTFNENTGEVSGTSIKFVRHGKYTLVGVALQEGFETVVVYQIDRQRNKVLVSQSRMSDKFAETLIPNRIWSFVGDARLIRN